MNLRPFYVMPPIRGDGVCRPLPKAGAWSEAEAVQAAIELNDGVGRIRTGQLTPDPIRDCGGGESSEPHPVEESSELTSRMRKGVSFLRKAVSGSTEDQ